jgi:hypothetical protein
MDNLNCCNVCEGQINVEDRVIVTSDAEMVAEAEPEHGRTAEFELPEHENYRGVYCPECWEELMSLEYRLWKQKGEERAKTSLNGTAPSKMALFGGLFKEKEQNA